MAYQPGTMSRWDVGAGAEERVARRLDELPGIGVLHDRVVPARDRAHLDHVVVTGSGILVVDTRSYRGRVDVSRSKLRVGGRDQTKLVRAVLQQVEGVRRIAPEVPVRASLCVVDGDFALLAPNRCRDVWVVGVRGLARLVKRMSDDHRVSVDAVTNRLSSALPPAAG